MLFLCAVVTLLIWLLIDTWKMVKMTDTLKEIIYPCIPLPIIGQAYKIISPTEYLNMLDVITEKALSNKYGVCAIWLGNQLCLFVADAKVAMKICNLPMCLNKGKVYKYVKAIVGEGSFFAPATIWRQQRKIMMPGFVPARLSSVFSEVLVPEAEYMVQNLKPMVGTKHFCIRKFINAYSIGTVYETVLGKKLDQNEKLGQEFLESLNVSLKIIAERIVKPWLQNDTIYKCLPKYKKLTHHIQFLWDVISKDVTEVREEIKLEKKTDPSKGNDLKFQPFIKTLIDYSGGENGYTDTKLREEILVLMIAAMDTSAVAMGFVCLLLARYPDVQEKVHQELDAILQGSSRRITQADLPRLQYLEAVIKETIRLYPPAPVISRDSLDDVTLSTGITVPKDTHIIFCISGINQNPRYWGDDADQFKPERWLTKDKVHPAAFMSFSYGVRNCPGYKYALMSIKTVLSTMLRHYKIVPEAAEKKNLKVRFNIMLNPVDGYLIRLEDKHNDIL